VPLAHGVAIVPLTEKLNGELEERFGPDGDEGLQGLPGGSGALLRWLRAASRSSFLAYVGAEYFGGMGTQWGVGLEAGAVVFGPVREPGVINQVLRRLGVRPHAGSDEFDTVGLGRFRHTDRWAGEDP
jgi:hypothetical protein